MIAFNRLIGAGVVAAGLAAGCSSEPAKGPEKSREPDKGLVLPPPVPNLVRNLDTTNEPPQVKAFVEAITPALPASGSDIVLSQDKALAIFTAGFRHLGGVEPPSQRPIRLSDVNAVISDKGYALSYDYDDGPKGPAFRRLTLIKLTQERREIDGAIFSPLLGLERYPRVTVVTATSTDLIRVGPESSETTPGRALMRANKDALIVVFPDQIKQQEAIFRASKVAVTERSLTEIAALNETGHYIFDHALQGKRIPEIQMLRVTLSPTNKLTMPPFDHHQAHEIASDAFTFKATTDTPAAVTILGRQTDTGHRASFQLLNNAVVYALYDYAQSAPPGAEATRRQEQFTALVRPSADGRVHINFDGVGEAMRLDPQLNARVTEVVRGVYTSVINGVFAQAE